MPLGQLQQHMAGASSPRDTSCKPSSSSSNNGNYRDNHRLSNGHQQRNVPFKALPMPLAVHNDVKYCNIACHLQGQQVFEVDKQHQGQQLAERQMHGPEQPASSRSFMPSRQRTARGASNGPRRRAGLPWQLAKQLQEWEDVSKALKQALACQQEAAGGNLSDRRAAGGP